MQCGISTACFYPNTTLEALECLAARGVHTFEIFLNTFSEMEHAYVSKLLRVVQAYGLNISSVHPFTGAMEGLLFASEYDSRTQDGLSLYRRYFEACQRLGADKLVFHGDHKFNVERFSFERYAENFILLAEVGLEYGVTLCHENVAYCRCSDTEAARALRAHLDTYAAFVLDLKQARRRNIGAYAMLEAMGEDVRQVHISDCTRDENCLPPGAGDFDFVPFIDSLKRQGYEGDLIIELYCDNYQDVGELLESKRYIETIIRRG